MSINKSILLFLTCVSFQLVAQKRVSFEVSSRISNLSCAVHYQKVFRSHFLFGGGILFGGKMRGFTPIDATYDELLNKSPFPELNKLYFEDTNTFELINYSTRSRSLSLTLNTGFFHNFGQVHGLRFNANFRVGLADAVVQIGYRNLKSNDHVLRGDVKRVNIFALSPEIYHTIRQSSKLTFFYGLKVPYFMNLTPEKHKPQFSSDAYYKFKPELVAGISYAFGKCD